jgi:hypothetical protein
MKKHILFIIVALSIASAGTLYAVVPPVAPPPLIVEPVDSNEPDAPPHEQEAYEQNVLQKLEEQKDEVIEPVINEFDPDDGESEEKITFTGTDLYYVKYIKFENIDAEFSVNSETEIEATVPNLGGSDRDVAIEVTSTSGATDILSDPFSYEAIEIIDRFTPTEGMEGEKIKLYGSNPNLIAAVKFNGVAGTDFKKKNDRVEVNVPNLGDSEISNVAITIVSTSGETYAVSGSFKYLVYQAPNITEYPSGGKKNDSIYFKGSNLNNVKEIRFIRGNNNKKASIQEQDNDEIKLKVPNMGGQPSNVTIKIKSTADVTTTLTTTFAYTKN